MLESSISPDCMERCWQRLAFSALWSVYKRPGAFLCTLPVEKLLPGAVLALAGSGRIMIMMSSIDPENADDAAGRADDPEVEAPLLTAEEARVLGCLLEKEQATPEYYPLTMNSLLAACNQKSNRHPVVEYNDAQVEEAVAGLRAKGFVLRVSVAGSRVPKFQHIVDRALPGLGAAEIAVLTVLLLRGPQTLGELRTRTERLHAFDSLEETQEALDALEVYPPRQLAKTIQAGGGRRVVTFRHLLCGDEEVSMERSGSAPAAPDRHERMEEELATLRAEVEALRGELDAFRAQFG